MVTSARPERVAARARAGCRALLDADAGLAQLVDDGRRCAGWQADLDVAAGDRAGAMKVPVSMRSGITVCSAPPSAVHALDADGGRAGALDARAHRVQSRSARSSISGSRAALRITVSPSASVAAIITFSVPVTVTVSKSISAPRSRSAAAST